MPLPRLQHNTENICLKYLSYPKPAVAKLILLAIQMYYINL